MDKLKELGLKLANYLISPKVIAGAIVGIAGVYGLSFIDEDMALRIGEAIDGLLPEFGEN